MRYKYKLLIYILGLNGLLIALAILFYSSNKWLFFGLEALFLLSLILGFRLYALFSRPFDLLASGIETLKSQDFSMQLKPVRSKEFNLLVSVYNKMIDQLRKERIALSEKNFLLTLLMDASPSGIVLFNVDDELVNMNEAASRFIGHPLEVLKGKQLQELSELSNGMFDQVLNEKNYVF
ncbi:MAG: PAS domain-containing protein, partial [Carboxylicivirga sp.]|nr:PAS domain-containing protein [Carboxylicivirga sp.]